MSRRCLICESSAILTKDAAVSIALLVSIAGGWLQAVHHTRKDARDHTSSPLEHYYNLLLGGLASVVPSYRSASQVAADITLYQFGDFNFLCLRCGARFNEEEAPT